jgi:hypothetical protein
MPQVAQTAGYRSSRRRGCSLSSPLTMVTALHLMLDVLASKAIRLLAHRAVSPNCLQPECRSKNLMSLSS